MLSSIYYNDTENHLNPLKLCCCPWLLFDNKPKFVFCSKEKRELWDKSRVLEMFSRKLEEAPKSILSIWSHHTHQLLPLCNCHRFFSLALVFLGAIAMFANVIVTLTIWLRVPLFLSLLLKLLLSLNRRYNPFSQHEDILALPGGSSDIGMYIWLLGWKEDKLRRFWK